MVMRSSSITKDLTLIAMLDCNLNPGIVMGGRPVAGEDTPVTPGRSVAARFRTDSRPCSCNVAVPARRSAIQLGHGAVVAVDLAAYNKGVALFPWK